MLPLNRTTTKMQAVKRRTNELYGIYFDWNAGGSSLWFDDMGCTQLKPRESRSLIYIYTSIVTVNAVSTKTSKHYQDTDLVFTNANIS